MFNFQLIMLLDIHTHHAAPYPEGVISAEPAAGFGPLDGQFYSLGLHPWHSDAPEADAILDSVQQLAGQPWVAAIGECGVDPNRGAPLYRQLLQFRRQVEISETAGKPLVIHAVKAADVIIGVHSDLAATRPWAIHGFRGKPTVAGMYLRAGLWLSFGERFNPDALRAMPRDRILAETDDSALAIEQILATQAEALGIPAAEYTALIAANTARFLGLR